MRKHLFALSAAALAVVASSAAEARPAFGATRAGGAASERKAESISIIEAAAALIGLGLSAKASPAVASDAPRSAAPRVEQCEEEKKRQEAAKADETRRTAEAQKERGRGGEPLYLAF